MADALTVHLSDRSYPIHIASGIGVALRPVVDALVTSRRRFIVLTDENVAALQAAALKEWFGDAPRWVVAPGESAKSAPILAQVWDFLASQRIDRSGAIFAVGGGVVGDLAGFAAATWLRGIDLYQIPTTLLAAVDSSVGGKTGINIAAGKNLVGAFHQPRGVFIDTAVLQTLPAREFAAGMAEVIKYGLLGDAGLFRQLEQATTTPGSAHLPDVIRRCCAAKAGVVEKDEREVADQGGRALLNLGHTFGHAIEQVAGYGTYLHGEAVAIGLCAAARLSAKLGLLPGADVGRVDAVVAAHHLPGRLRAPLRLSALLEAMSRDKKVRAGLPRFVVLKRIGEAATLDGVSPALAEACFREVGAT